MFMQQNIFFNDWVHRRHISQYVIDEFGVHWGYNPVFGECIVIPVHTTEGEIAFNKYRRDPRQEQKPKYLYDKGSSIVLYGLHKIINEKSILITEGELDALVAWSAHIPATTSTGGASSFQKSWQTFFSDKEVTICFDNDEAGAQGMVRALEYIPHAYIMFLPDRPGIKDISDYVASGGDLHELMRTRVRFTCLQDVIDHRAQRLSLWQSTYFHDAYIEKYTKPVHVPREYSSDVEDEISRAKAYPIQNLISFTRYKACCIWHNEKTPSLQYYPKNNVVHCFGCGKHADAIDVYRQLHNCSFKEAVQKLQ